MALVLATHPLLHRRFFRTSRRRLEGKEILIFSAVEYETAVEQQGASTEQVSRFIAWTQSGLLGVAKVVLSLILLASIVMIGTFVLPEAYAKFFPEAASEVITQAPTEAEQVIPVVEVLQKYEPPFDETLPLGTWVSIPKIGLETQAQATVNPDEALDYGVWMVPDFGTPGSQEDPIIMAAHRFGWKWWWQDDYWRKHSFYLLTDTVPGDRIEIIYEQRKWTYEIYAGEEGTEITDYDADLILYTCKFLNSPIRYFRYARLVEDPELEAVTPLSGISQSPIAAQ
jgi:hypothetical protein